MSIYNNPEMYAKETHITLEQAEIRCAHFRKLEELSYIAKKCPSCGQHTLVYEEGSYEEGYSSYVYCENDKLNIIEDGEEYESDCEFTSNVTKPYEAIRGVGDLDIVLMFAFDLQKNIKAVERMVGCQWSEFVENNTKQICNGGDLLETVR